MLLLLKAEREWVKLDADLEVHTAYLQEMVVWLYGNANGNGNCATGDEVTS